MLRVLTLSTLYPDRTRPGFGGFVERQVRALAARPDIEVRVVAPFAVPPWPLARFHPGYSGLIGLPRREARNGVDVLRVPFPPVPAIGARINPWSLRRTVTPILDSLRADFAFDVIDAEFFYPDGPAAVALGRRYGVPVSIKARGSDIHYWGRLPATRDKVLAAGRKADGMLAVSAALRADMMELGMPGDRIGVHHTGVDQVAFRPQDRDAAKQRLGVSGPLMVSAGNLIPLKGHGMLVEAIRTLPGATLLIAGAGPEEGRLSAQIAAAGVGDRVRLLGPLPHAELPALFAAADVMALPSASEGLANVWVEALACGTPVVITDVGGAREVVSGAAAGRLVERNPVAIAAGIADVLANPHPQDEVRAAVRDFTWERNSQALYDHLSDLAERAR